MVRRGQALKPGIIASGRIARDAALPPRNVEALSLPQNPRMRRIAAWILLIINMVLWSVLGWALIWALS